MRHFCLSSRNIDQSVLIIIFVPIWNFSLAVCLQHPHCTLIKRQNSNAEPYCSLFEPRNFSCSSLIRVPPSCFSSIQTIVIKLRLEGKTVWHPFDVMRIGTMFATWYSGNLTKITARTIPLNPSKPTFP